MCVHVGCLCVSLLSSLQPPPAQLAVISGGGQDFSHIRMNVRPEVVQRPAKSSGRQTKVKILTPHARSSVEDEIFNLNNFLKLFIMYVEFVTF